MEDFDYKLVMFGFSALCEDLEEVQRRLSLYPKERYELEIGEDTAFAYYKEADKNILELIESGKVSARLEIATQGEKTDVSIKDGNGNVLGTISVSTTSTNQDIIMNITEEDTSLDITYNKKITIIQLIQCQMI